MSDINVNRPVTGTTADYGSGLGNTEADTENTKAGMGVSAYAAKAVPDPAGNSAASSGGSASGARSYGTIMASLGRLISKSGGDALDAELAAAIAKMKDVIGDVQTGKLLNDEERKRSMLSEKTDKIKDAQAKFDEAQEAKEDASIWNWIKIAFTAVAAAVSIAVGSALVATGVGAPIGALMIAGGVVGLIMTLDAVLQEATGKGIAGNIAYDVAIAQGKTEEEATKAASEADTAFAITMAVVAVALAIGTLGVGFSSLGSAVSSTASATTQIAMKTVQTVGTVTESVATIGGATASIGQAVTMTEAAEHSADGKRLQADGKDTEALLQTLDDFIDILMNQISGTNSRFNAMLESIQGSMNDRANTMARAQFSG